MLFALAKTKLGKDVLEVQSFATSFKVIDADDLVSHC